MHMCVQVLSVESDSATPWSVAHQAPLSMGLAGGFFTTDDTQEASCWNPIPYVVMLERGAPLGGD